MTLPPILTLSFWFNPTPPPLLVWSEWILLVILVACVVAGIAVAVVRARSGFEKLVRRGLGRVASLLITVGLAGLLLFAFAYERIPYLGMRLWWIGWAVLVGIWAWGIVRYFQVDIPAIRKQRAEREQFEKWLPKSKK
jgi:hypothetical protein